MDSFWAPSLIVLAVGLAWAAAGTFWARRRARVERDRRREAPPLSDPARIAPAVRAPRAVLPASEPAPRPPIAAQAGTRAAPAIAWPAVSGNTDRAPCPPDATHAREPAPADDVRAATAADRSARVPARRAPRASDLAA
ncbi:MAG: hypothetical protein H6931_15895 [Burkholderiaceae bacterium]|jgi:hypothetical protein|nr:hypothetical protein [Burkholderiaceae bacterium]MCP5290576.1 hypothetical protein [Burkholderiaceae bacterium]